MAKKSILGFIRDQCTRVPPVVQADLTGKTIIIIGANTGLGFEAAQHFAKMRVGRLIMACRSRARGEAAVQRLKQATQTDSSVELWLLDLADFASVRAFVDKALRDLERLDILILNAAFLPGMKGDYTETKDGWETSLQVNNLSGSLIALLLLPRMLETARSFESVPRIVVVSSDGHYWTSLDDKVIESPNGFELIGKLEYCTPKIMRVRYQDSKLLNIFFTRALNSHLKTKTIIINTVNPGFCHSKIRRNMKSPCMTMFELLARSTEEGSRHLIWAAIGLPKSQTDDDLTNNSESSLEKLRGGYINLNKVDEPADFVLGDAGKKVEDKLWKIDLRIGEVVTEHLV